MFKSTKQRKNSAIIKLPSLNSKNNDQGIVLSRPSSSKKLNELNDVLLKKFDEYDQGAKNKIIQVGSKKGKFNKTHDKLSQAKQIKTNGQFSSKYEKLRKFMPQVYGKLNSMKSIQDNSRPIEPISLQKVIDSNRQNNNLNGNNRMTIELNEQNIQFYVSQEETDKILQIYNIKYEGNTSEDLVELKQNLAQCQKGIDDVQLEMSNILRQLVNNYLQKDIE